ncbi:MAG: hypothetical protein ACYTGH_04190, partial [Planctomycetota bacterium]
HFNQEEGAFLCPSHELTPNQSFNPYGGTGDYGKLKNASYVMNTISGSATAWQGATLSRPADSHGFIGRNRSSALRLAWVKTPRKAIYIVDRAPRLDYATSWNAGNTISARGINRYSETDYGVAYLRPTTAYRKVNYLHQEGFAALFGDGHVEKRTRSTPEEWVAYVR